MPQPCVTLLGAYRVAARDVHFSHAMALKYPNNRAFERARSAAERAVRDELGDAILFEVALDHRDSRFSVDDFGPEGSDQAPNDGAILSEDGVTVLSTGLDVPLEDRIRLAFFLHFENLSMPLATSYRPVPIRPVASMPERLARRMPYEPVD